jgi:purine-binding chemotaxis protein CheW
MEFVSFNLGTEAYAIDVWHAREIVDAPELSRLPNAPAWIPGVMNLRGRVVPVVDLKRKFGLSSDVAAKGRGYVIVVELPHEDGVITVGVAADSVIEVFDLADPDLTPPPRFGERFSRAYLRGMARRPRGLVAVMDAEKVLADTDALDLAEGDEAAEASTPEES